MDRAFQRSHPLMLRGTFYSVPPSFGAPEIISGTPKQLAARLKARDGLHSTVVAPESGKSGTKN